MTEHVQDLLIQESFRQFNSFSLKSFHRLKPLKDTEWTTENPLVNDYQCIILLDQQHTGDMCQLNHSIRSQTGVQSSIPCYNVKHVWSEEQINQILSKLGTDKIALGVSKSLKTVDLAIALWRCRKFAV
ncbi:hypothetical protein G6F56_013449 [Rhizopus delemar]|nr:hypothetical protein G6F56_013449 [Rhizopus delemar]